MKAVIYARYSSDNQREESIEGQIRECTAFAKKNGITILRHYIDRAFSAKTDNRPEFQNMIKDSGKHLFDMIIVWKLDRFARNRYDSARYKAALKKNGVKVVSATEVISDGAEGIILESVLEGYAEYYSADLSEKVVRGMTENALKSKYNGGTLPIGYQIDSDQCFQLDPLTAPFVREAFQRYDEGATMTAIRDWLNEQGVKNTRGQKMTYNSVQHLLNNRRYIGEYTYRDIVVPDGIPAIVPQDLFERVQEKLAKNKKAPACHKAEDDYLLTTKLFCGYCGAYLCGESGTSHTGNVHHYYDSEYGGFYLSGTENETLLFRPKECYDGAIPSGNSLIAYVLGRLNALLPDQSWENILNKQLAYMAGEAEKSPAGFSVFLMALSDFLEPPVLITVVPSGEDLSDLPFAVPSDAIVKVLDRPLEGYKLLNDETTFYVCRNQSCLPPMNKRQLMMEILKRDQN